MIELETSLLEKNISEDDRRQIQNILEQFTEATDDKSTLGKIANSPETLAAEKKLVPFLNKQSNNLPPCDILVCPVGFRPAPVILITLILKPKFLYLVHSQASRTKAEQIRDDSDIQLIGLNPIENIHLRSVDLTSAPETYEVIREVVRKHPQDRIVVDITGGVKVMGVSLAAAAFWQRLPVVYLYGEEVNGIIKPFTEKLNVLKNPYEHFGDSEFKLLKAFFNNGNYDAALNICISLRDTVGDVSTLGLLDILEEFIILYKDWDNFAHSQSEDNPDRKLATRLRVLIGKMNRLNITVTSTQHIQLNLEFLEKIEQSWQENRRNLFDEYRLIDIFCSAQRRAKAGKYDEAVARLYRCLEMSATIALANDWNIGNPRTPDLSTFEKVVGGKEKLQQLFKKTARYPLPDGHLGLDAQMVLLAIGNQKKHKTMYGIFIGMKKGQLMEQRNRSTLAHGTIPVPQSTYEEFNKKTKEIISWVVGKERIVQLIEQATHPEIEFSESPQ